MTYENICEHEQELRDATLKFGWCFHNKLNHKPDYNYAKDHCGFYCDTCDKCCNYLYFMGIHIGLDEVEMISYVYWANLDLDDPVWMQESILAQARKLYDKELYDDLYKISKEFLEGVKNE